MFLRQTSRLLSTKQTSIGVLGALLKRGQPRQGTDHAPKVIRQAGLLEKLEKYNNVIDLGDYKAIDYEEPKYGKINHPITVGRNNHQLCRLVSSVIKNHEMLVTLGGDHTTAIGTIYGHYYGLGETPAIIWVDAHADINTPQSTITGNLHGAAVSFLLEEFRSSAIPMSGFEWINPVFRSSDIAYIGLRDVEKQEKEILKRFGITAFFIKDLDELGIDEVLQSCLSKVDPKNNRNIHLSFDIDAMDPSLAPATGTPVTGGLYQYEGEYICETLHDTGRLRSVDLVEVNPCLSTVEGRERTVKTAVSLLEHCVGRKSNHDVEKLRAEVKEKEKEKEK